MLPAPGWYQTSQTKFSSTIVDVQIWCRIKQTFRSDGVLQNSAQPVENTRRISCVSANCQDLCPSIGRKRELNRVGCEVYREKGGEFAGSHISDYLCYPHRGKYLEVNLN